MLFRGRTPESSIWRRFRAASDLFALRREGELYVARASANAERTVDLFHDLVGQMPPVVDFSMECFRSGRTFVGQGLQLIEVTEAIARLKVLLVASAGVELCVYTGDEQIALSALLDLWIHARNDRWLYLLLGRGLEQREELPERGWTIAARRFYGRARACRRRDGGSGATSNT